MRLNKVIVKLEMVQVILACIIHQNRPILLVQTKLPILLLPLDSTP